MPSLFSDPFFRRGATLLAGETIEINADTGLPAAGGDVVGQVKVFQDVNPTTGVRNSNRLVYCVAARWKGSDVSQADMANLSSANCIRGRVVKFSEAAPLTEFSLRATTNATAQTGAETTGAGQAFGVVDEYLTGAVRTNDIIWLVVKGPTSIYRTAAAVNPGKTVTLSTAQGTSAGTVVEGTTLVVGQCIEAAATAASAGLTRVNVASDTI